MSFLRPSSTTFRKRAILHREDGATLLEFAFSCGIFIGITFGIIILCWALFSYEYVDYAAREAARWASVRGSECSYDSTTMPDCNADQPDIASFVKSLNFPLINTDPSILTVTAGWYQANVLSPSPGNPETWNYCGAGNVCNTPGNEVHVTVSYSFAYFIPFIGNFAPKVSSTSQWVISQ